MVRGAFSGTTMKKFLTYALAALVIALAVYGGITLLSGFLNKSPGQLATEMAQPFAHATVDAAGDRLTQTLNKTPDAQLEKNSEWMASKLYPIGKGIIKGGAESFLQDPQRSEVPDKMYQAGKEFSETILKPFTRGVYESNQKNLQEADKTLQALRKFSDTNSDLMNALSQGLDTLIKKFKENPPLRPELPPIPPGPTPPPSPGGAGTLGR